MGGAYKRGNCKFYLQSSILKYFPSTLPIKHFSFYLVRDNLSPPISITEGKKSNVWNIFENLIIIQNSFILGTQ